MSFLDRIVVEKGEEVARARALCPESALLALAQAAPPPRDFAGALVAAKPIALIAEIKRRSPSAGVIRGDLDPATIARAYEAGGAACLSVLTDEVHFGGSLTALREAREAVSLPVLRKDFIVDEYQIIEARAWGADAVLLIAGMLTHDEVAGFHAVATRLGMSAIVEVHDEDDIEIVRLANCSPHIIGINNRDLKAQRTDLGNFERLVPMVRELAPIIVAESGIVSAHDAAHVASAGANAMLVGESLLRHRDIETATRNLLFQIDSRSESI